MVKKIFAIMWINLIYFSFSQAECIKNTVRVPFSAKITANWKVSRLSKFNVNIALYSNALFDVFAKFISSAGENLEIYKFNRKIAIYDRNANKWIPYKKNIYLKGIKLLNLREFFKNVLGIISKNTDHTSVNKCYEKIATEQFNLSVNVDDVKSILHFLFDKNEIPQDARVGISIVCDCNHNLKSVLVRFYLQDKDIRIKGNVNLSIAEQHKKYEFNIPIGIKKFLGKYKLQ